MPRHSDQLRGREASERWRLGKEGGSRRARCRRKGGRAPGPEPLQPSRLPQATFRHASVSRASKAVTGRRGLRRWLAGPKQGSDAGPASGVCEPPWAGAPVALPLTISRLSADRPDRAGCGRSPGFSRNRRSLVGGFAGPGVSRGRRVGPKGRRQCFFSEGHVVPGHTRWYREHSGASCWRDACHVDRRSENSGSAGRTIAGPRALIGSGSGNAVNSCADRPGSRPSRLPVPHDSDASARVQIGWSGAGFAGPVEQKSPACDAGAGPSHVI